MHEVFLQRLAAHSKFRNDQEIYGQERIHNSEEKNVSQSAVSEDMKNS
ncbi:hypothetical protein B4U79_12983, partial [Dinothrombium tinctorium]